MQCPTCNVALQMTDRSGVEIDYCPQCRGVWLDRGELDKIIARNASSMDANWQRDGYRDESPAPHGGYQHKKKESFLGDLFDF